MAPEEYRGDDYSEGYDQGYADAQEGCDYVPEEDGAQYAAGYEDGYDAGLGDG